MTKFISNPENLKMMMNLLREKSKNIQFEAFHVFKVLFATWWAFLIFLDFYRQSVQNKANSRDTAQKQKQADYILGKFS